MKTGNERINMTITEVSKKFDLTPETLRYYEKIGLLDPIQRKSNGIRDYSEEDLKRIEFIKCMRQAGLGIEVLKRYIDLLNKGDKTLLDRKELLLEQRRLLAKRMEEMQETLSHLDYKIENYEKMLINKK